MEHFVCIDIKFNYEYNFSTSPRIQAIYSFTLSILAESVKNILERMQTMQKEEHTTANREHIQWNQPKQKSACICSERAGSDFGEKKGRESEWASRREKGSLTLLIIHMMRERVLWNWILFLTRARHTCNNMMCSYFVRIISIHSTRSTLCSEYASARIRPYTKCWNDVKYMFHDKFDASV